MLTTIVLVALSSSAVADEPLDMKVYWPQPSSSEVLIVRFDSNRLNFYRRTGETFVLGDYWHRHTDRDEPSTLIWGGDWHYRVDPQQGVVEFWDDLPGLHTTRLKQGYGLNWGNFLKVGQTIENRAVFEGQTIPFGYQKVTLVAHLDRYSVNGMEFRDVIKLDNVQVGCKGSTEGAGGADETGPVRCPSAKRSSVTLYLARELGIIRFENAVIDEVPSVFRVETVKKICRTHVSPGEAYCK